MSTPVDQAKAYAAELTKAGVRATHDPRKVAPPCILIAPPRVVLDMNCGGTAQWTALALATVVGNSDAWQQLDRLVAKALPILPVESIDPQDYSVDDVTTYAAFALNWEGPVEWSDQ